MIETAIDLRDQLKYFYFELQDEHAQIMQELGRIKEMHSRETLVPLLEDLHTLLTAHFAQETYPGGFYEAMGACTSEHRDSVRVLVDDHFRILSKLWGLKERARLAETDLSGEIAEEVSAMVEILESHERREHKLATQLLG